MSNEPCVLSIGAPGGRRAFLRRVSRAATVAAAAAPGCGGNPAAPAAEDTLSVVTDAVTSIDVTTATFNGRVNAGGRPATVWFEFDFNSLDEPGTTNPSTLPSKRLTPSTTVSDPRETPVSVQVTGLICRTDYNVRIVGSRAGCG